MRQHKFADQYTTPTTLYNTDMHNYIAYISGGKSHALLDAHNALQSIADNVDLFVHSGEGFSVLLTLYAVTFFVMLMLLKRSNDDATFFRDVNEDLVDKMQDSHVEYHTLKMFVDNLKENGYVRNKHGVMQRIDDWMENGSRMPRRKEKKRDDKAVMSEKADRKPHQLKPWMQVIRPTKKQRRDIHKACIDAGIKIDPLDELLRHDLVCFGHASDEVVSTWVTSTNDINIPFEEFMARIKGEWVEPKVKAEQPKGSVFIEVREAKLPEVMNDRIPDVFRKPEQKTMTRAEACLAILHEAKDAGFEWAESAIEQFDEKLANLPSYPYSDGLQRAIMEFADHSKTTEGFEYWDNVLDYKEVKSFKPKTKWPA